MKDKEYYLEASTNNTYSLDCVEDSLNEIITTSYKYLYDIQKSNTGYQRFDFKMSDLLRSNTVNNLLTYYPRKWVLYVDDNFIAENKRLNFKRSPLYNKEISFYDTIDNPDVFSYSFVMFVDGLFFLDGVNILCKEDKTYFIFNIKERPNDIGIPMSKFNELMEKDADITIWYIPSAPVSKYKTNMNIVKKYMDVGLPLDRFRIPNTRIITEPFLTFVTGKDESQATLYQTCNDSDNLYFMDEEVTKLPNPEIDIHLFNFKYISEIVKIRGENNFFTLDIKEMPIPIEHVMIFDTHGRYRHNIDLKLYYPNVYEVIGREGNEPLDIYVFYYDDTISTLHEYRNELAIYYKYSQNVLDRYKDGSIPEIIKEYMPLEIDYSIKDYHNSIYAKDHFKYKNEELRGLIKQDAEYLRPYLNRQVKKSNGYYINVANLDLLSKLRYNNKDVGAGALFEIFDEPCYMFVFRNEYTDTFMNLTWFVDGEIYKPDKIYRNEFYEFYYLPTKLVRHTTIIEIEKMDEVVREYRTKFTKVDEVKSFELNKKSSVNVYNNDIFLTLENGDIVSTEDFEIVNDFEGNELIQEKTKFFNIDKTLKIKLTNPLLVNVVINIHIKKNCRMEDMTILTEDDILGPLRFNIDVHRDSRHIRVYRNGQLISPYFYDIKWSKNIRKENKIYLHQLKEIGDIYTIECLPLKLKEVAFVRELPLNGFVDLNGKIDKPLGLKWYDIFVNGRKLNKNQIEFISPTKMIIKDVSSNMNLSVLEVDRDREYFGFENSYNIIDRIWDIDEDFRNDVDNAIEDLEVTEDDVVNEELDRLSAVIYDFWYDYLRYMEFINPDLSQIPDYIAEEFSPLFDMETKTCLLNPDIGGREGEAIKVFEINPDRKK